MRDDNEEGVGVCVAECAGVGWKETRRETRGETWREKTWGFPFSSPVAGLVSLLVAVSVARPSTFMVDRCNRYCHLHASLCLSFLSCSFHPLPSYDRGCLE